MTVAPLPWGKGGGVGDQERAVPQRKEQADYEPIRGNEGAWGSRLGSEKNSREERIKGRSAAAVDLVQTVYICGLYRSIYIL